MWGCCSSTYWSSGDKRELKWSLNDSEWRSIIPEAHIQHQADTLEEKTAPWKCELTREGKRLLTKLKFGLQFHIEIVKQNCGQQAGLLLHKKLSVGMTKFCCHIVICLDQQHLMLLIHCSCLLVQAKGSRWFKSKFFLCLNQPTL